MKKDIISKDIVEAIAKDIATYLLGLQISEIEFVQQEMLRVEKREADTVLLCKINGTPAILHLEFQNNNDSSMPIRMLRYFTDIRQRYNKRPIYQYVIYIGKDALNMPDHLREQSLEYRYNLVDMHKIDCETLLALDNPDALVLAVLCDFKEKNEKDVLTYIVQRLNQLVGNDSHGLGHYMLMLETLSENRQLQQTLEEVEAMLRETSLKNLPSYNIGLKYGKLEGLQQGLEQGIEQGKLNTAIEMIAEFGLSAESVAKKLNLPLDELMQRLSQLNKH